MASSLNKVMLIGNLGKDAETRHTPSGVAVTNFSLATTFRTKDQNSGEWNEKTDWHDVVLWKGERVAPYLKKGKKVFVEGRLQTRSWEDQQGQKRYRTEVVCDSFGLMLLSSREGGSDYSGGQGGFRSSGGGGGSGQDSDYSSPSEGGSGQPSASGQSEGTSGGAAGSYDDDDIPF